MIRLHLPLAKALLSQDMRVTAIGVPMRATVANREGEALYIEGLQYLPWAWHGRRLMDSVRAIPMIAHQLRELNPGVVHVNAVSDLPLVAVSLRMARLTEIRPVVVAMSRNSLTWTSSRKAWMGAKLVTCFADGFVALAGSHKQKMLDLGVKPEMLACIPNPCDARLVDMAGQRKPKVGGSAGRSFRITYVAALRRCKAQDVLVKAAAGVCQVHRQVRFDLIGSPWPGEEVFEKMLRGLIDELQLVSHIRLLGALPHEEVIGALIDADMVVFPTLAEMMPRAVIEAMMLGKPVIASAVDGILDLIEDGKTGILVKPGDVDGLSRALRRLIENPSLASELALAGQAHVREFCSPERVGRLFCQFYAHLMEARGGG
jgi:glycosyltransferase involved in cell wall biosynthesis